MSISKHGHGLCTCGGMLYDVPRPWQKFGRLCGVPGRGACGSWVGDRFIKISIIIIFTREKLEKNAASASKLPSKSLLAIRSIIHLLEKAWNIFIKFLSLYKFDFHWIHITEGIAMRGWWIVRCMVLSSKFQSSTPEQLNVTYQTGSLTVDTSGALDSKQKKSF